MKAKRLGLLLGSLGLLAVVAATTMAVARPSAQGATAAKQPAVLEFSVMIGDPDFDLLRVVPIIRAAANIGSSGQDGFAVDSFFDITYKKVEFGLPSPGHTTLTVMIHAVPNSPDVDPVAVIANVKKALDEGILTKGGTPAQKEFKGHVTLMK